MSFARGLTLSLSLIVACSGEPCASAAAGGAPASSERVEKSDAELMRYLHWQVDLGRLVARHRAEQEDVVQRVTSRSPGPATGLQHDPELLALVSRQRAEMQRFMAGAPTGPTATAIGETLPALGTSTAGPGGMTLVYMPRRDEAALDAARAKYGTAFVDWMLDHEATINATLGTQQQ